MLKIVERLSESVYRLRVCARLETRWLYHVHLLIYFALKKGVLDVHLVEVPPFGRCERDQGSNDNHLCHLGKVSSYSTPCVCA